MPLDDKQKLLIKVIGIPLAIGALLIVILVPMSYSYLEYYEMGFKRQKSTGTVDTETVYDSGRALLGPDFEFKAFQRDAHNLTLDNIQVFTSDKLEVGVTMTLQYFLRKSDLPALHKAYDLYYEEIMKNSAIDAVKGATVTFDTRGMISDRFRLEDTLYNAVRQRLGGACCAEDCNLFTKACPSGCIPYASCKDSDKGLFVDVKHFQLGAVSISPVVMQNYMTSLTLQEETLTEQLLQDAQVIRKNTSAMVLRIRNEASEIQQNGTAQANYISTVAAANYTAAIEKARSEGLKQVFNRLGVSTQSYKSSFDYLRTLRGLDNVHITVDYQQRIAGNL